LPNPEIKSNALERKMMTIKILLVDDHTLFRSGMKLLLQRNPEFEIVGEASDGLEGVKRAKQLRPDVVLMDLNMAGLSGLEAMQLIVEDMPEVAVLMLTVSEEAEDLSTALKNGARGYLLKNIEADYLTQAIKRAAAGESVIAESMTAKLIMQFRNGMNPAPSPEKEKLTPRERETMVCVARGESNKEIARNLNVAESTVKIHVQNILKKLSLSSRVQIAVYAVERGLDK
jgi:two-component system nitrate/nitrite response regulator NarL